MKPRDMMLAIKDDAELNKLLGRADFFECGVVPTKQLDKKGKKAKCGADEVMEEEN